MNAEVGPEKRVVARGSTTVILVDDHELARHGVRHILGNDASIEVVGEAEDTATAVSLITQLHPDVVILDIRLHRGNGIEVSRAVKKLAPESRVLVLSAYDDSQYVVSMVKLGVNGYLTKDSSGENLIKAVHYAAEGWLIFSPDIADKLAGLLRKDGGASLDGIEGEEEHRDLPRGQRSGEKLTGREAEVLRHMFGGLRNRDIAEAMGISVKTVEAHMHQILLKLSARNRSQAIVNSLGMGYLQGIAVPAGLSEDDQPPFASRKPRPSPKSGEGET